MKGINVTYGPQSGDEAVRARLLDRLGRWLEKGATSCSIAAVSPSPPPPHALVPNRVRVFIVLSGCRHVRIAGREEGRDVYLRRGDVLFCPRESWHQLNLDSRHSLITLIFDREHTSIKWKTTERGSMIQSVAPPVLSTGTRHLLQALESEEEEGPEGVAMINALIRLAMRDLERAGGLPDRSRAAWLRIRGYLEEHFRSPINRDSVARALDLHPNHVSRLFRQHDGATFSTVLATLRLDEAARLLRDSVLPVNEVAVQCGFASSNYFGKVFRRAYGQSPGRFRAESLQLT